MSSQIQITGETKVKSLTGVLVGTTGVVSSLNIDGSLGIPQLDVNGKILVSQLPNSIMEYKGVWNAATNTPTLVNGTGNQGDVYLCNVAGTVDFGAGPIAFVVGDQVIYSGSIWQRASGATGTVTSVAITESGDSLNITGSPITTSGTINIGFNGTNLQYVNGAGNLTTFPILTGYVPYTGATQDVDLGAFKLNAQSLHIKGTAGNGHLGLKHQSASATASANEVSLFADSLGDLSWLNGNLYLSKFILSGNTAARSYTFPNATCNIPNDSLVVHLAGTETITGAKTFSGYTTFTSTLDITSGLTFSNSGFTLVLQPPTLSVNRTVTLPNGTGTLALTSDIPSLTGYVPYTGATANLDLAGFSLYLNNSQAVFGRNLAGTTAYSLIGVNASNKVQIDASALGVVFGGTIGNGTYTYTLPSATGTLALTSALSAYLPLAGGTLTGPLGGTSAIFSGASYPIVQVVASATFPILSLNNSGQSSQWNIEVGRTTSGNLEFYNSGTKLSLTSLGNLGLGVTPSAWAVKAIDISTTGAVFGDGIAFDYTAGISQNCYRSGNTTWNYKLTGVGTSRFELNSNIFSWYQAPSGTAGNAITFTQAMTLTAAGNLGVNIATPVGGGGAADRTIMVNASTSGAAFFTSGVNGTRYSTLFTSTSEVILETNAAIPLALSVNEVKRLIIDTSGRTSIGYTTNPSTYMLDVNGTGRFSVSSGLNLILEKSTGAYLSFQNGATIRGSINGNNGTDGINLNYGASHTTALSIASTGAATFSSSVTASQFLATSSSNAAIITSTGTTGYGLVAVGSSGGARDILLVGQSGVSNGFTVQYNGTAMVYAMANGNLSVSGGSVTATSFFESSDSRLKTLIQDNYQTKGIASITPKLYTKNGKVELGYYAQDFIGVLDSAVSKGSDEMLSLSYREVLVAKVYALEQEIKELKAKMN